MTEAFLDDLQVIAADQQQGSVGVWCRSDRRVLALICTSRHASTRRFSARCPRTVPSGRLCQWPSVTSLISKGVAHEFAPDVVPAIAAVADLPAATREAGNRSDARVPAGA